MSNQTMADLLAKQNDKTQYKLFRGQALKGSVIAILPQEIILDLGAKAEGVLFKKDLIQDYIDKLHIGMDLDVYVVYPESESGQVIVSTNFLKSGKTNVNFQKWNKFINSLGSTQTINGKGVELNRGGLVVESFGLRGFVPISQIATKFISSPQDLIGKEMVLKVIEADPNTNRLIFAQKASLTPDTREVLEKIEVGDKIKGRIEKVLSLGASAEILEIADKQDTHKLLGFIHVSDLSWERVEDASSKVSEGEEINAQVLSVDTELGKVNLSMKILQTDPFETLSQRYQSDDVVKGVIKEINPQGVVISLSDGVEGLLPNESKDTDKVYIPGEEITLLIDKVDSQKRRITLAPFLTTTSGLIYK